MIAFTRQGPTSILFITLDSCRYDAFVEACAPNLKSIGPLHRTMAPGNFTYSSHAAMFVGFTPGIANRTESYINPKYGKIFRMEGGGFEGVRPQFIRLEGSNLIEGLKRKGYWTLGTGAVGWFDPQTDTGKALTCDFHEFYYPGNSWSIEHQMGWVWERLERVESENPVFVFINVGETHVPYYYEGAPWDPDWNPCVPFSETNDAAECRRRQIACLEYVDKKLAPLLKAFEGGTTVICADHGDCWGEDGLWEHGMHHEKVLEVPLLFRLGAVPEDPRAAGAG
jgi:hypothetical protein